MRSSLAGFDSFPISNYKRPTQFLSNQQFQYDNETQQKHENAPPRFSTAFSPSDPWKSDSQSTSPIIPLPTYAEPLNYRNPLDSSFSINDVEVLNPNSFEFVKTTTMRGFEEDFGRNVKRNVPKKLKQNLQNSKEERNPFLFSSNNEIEPNQNFLSQPQASTTSRTAIMAKSWQTPMQTSDLIQNNFQSSDAGQGEPIIERRTSVPVSKSGWTILDEIDTSDEDYDYNGNGDYQDYSYDYQYSNRRSLDTTESQFRKLHYSILSAPADIPKLGVQTDFKPIEVIYNEMFQGGAQRSPPVKSARFIPFESFSKEIMTTSTTQSPILPTPPVRVQKKSILRKRILDTNPRHFSMNDEFNFSKVQRRKKSLAPPNPFLSGENVLHAFVQNELFNQDSE